MRRPECKRAEDCAGTRVRDHGVTEREYRRLRHVPLDEHVFGLLTEHCWVGVRPDGREHAHGKCANTFDRASQRLRVVEDRAEGDVDERLLVPLNLRRKLRLHVNRPEQMPDMAHRMAGDALRIECE